MGSWHFRKFNLTPNLLNSAIKDQTIYQDIGNFNAAFCLKFVGPSFVYMCVFETLGPALVR